MTRVLLVCPEPLGHGQPAGIGIRFTEIARVLRGDGHEVTLLAPDSGLSFESIAAESERADAAVVQGHVANAFFEHAKPVPTVVDLYDPFIIENLHYHATRGAEVYQYDHATLVNSLLRGDLFLCASRAQRFFYLGALLAVGRLHPVAFENDPSLESLVQLAPFGVHPPRPLSARLAQNDAAAILFGGIYDWYDPILAIDAVAIARRDLPEATLTFTTHPNPELTPQGKLAAAMEHVRRNCYESFVRFEPWVAYEERAAFFERFTVALLTFPQSIETDLAMRTRVYDYLWCGLPIVTSSAPGTDEILEKYGAGIVVRDEKPESFARELVHVLKHRAEMTHGSQRFVDDHQWPRTLEPLRAFCRAPRFDATKELFASRPALVERPPSMLDRLKRRLAR